MLDALCMREKPVIGLCSHLTRKYIASMRDDKATYRFVIDTFITEKRQNLLSQ
jgi:hypothetical protein